MGILSYWINDVKMTSKVQPGYRLLNRWPRKPGDEVELFWYFEQNGGTVADFTRFTAKYCLKPSQEHQEDNSTDNIRYNGVNLQTWGDLNLLNCIIIRKLNPFQIHLCIVACVMSREFTRQTVMKFLPAQFPWIDVNVFQCFARCIFMFHSIRDWSKSMGGGGGGAGAERGWVMRFWALCKGWVVQFSATLRGWVTLFYYLDKH